MIDTVILLTFNEMWMRRRAMFTSAPLCTNRGGWALAQQRPRFPAAGHELAWQIPVVLPRCNTEPNHESDKKAQEKTYLCAAAGNGGVRARKRRGKKKGRESKTVKIEKKHSELQGDHHNKKGELCN